MKGLSRTDFGRHLRHERERRGIALASIAESTKIKASLLVGLERGDISQWPGGIFRRSYVRTYAAAVGLAPDTTLDEFLQLFPDEAGGDGERGPGVRQGAGPMRLSLAIEPRDRLHRIAARVALAVGELGLILLLGAVIAWLGSMAFWTASGVVALLYYPLVAACIGPARHPREFPQSVARCARTLRQWRQDTRRRRLYVIPQPGARPDAASGTTPHELPRRRTAAS